MNQPGFPEEDEIIHDEPEGIQFSEEPNQQADVIIEQHAPYVVPEPAEDLLELDEETEKEAFILDAEADDTLSGEALSAETLISVLVKDETDMEEPDQEESEVPIMDEVEPEPELNENHRLISNFIKEEPGPIRADKHTRLKGDVSLSSIQEHDGFITDTLAQIYVKQGLYAKAIYAYEKLSLKYPEKSAYFAAQIEKIRNINHS